MYHVETLLSKGKTEEALKFMDELPTKVFHEPDIQLMYALSLMEYGDLDQAGKTLRDLERKNPRFWPLYPVLAGWYLSHEWPAHAYRAFQKISHLSTSDEEADESVQDMITVARSMLNQLADTFDIPFEKAEQASWHHEQAQLALTDQNLARVERETRDALEIIPNWTAPRNNRSYALYLLGRIEDAITDAEAVVSKDPDNIHGLKNLTHFHYGIGRLEKAQEYADQLFDLASKVDYRGFEIDIIASALALIEDTEHLWILAQKFVRKHSDALFSSSWFSLAVAAARLGHFKDSMKLLKRAIRHEEFLPAENLLDDVNSAITNQLTKLVWPPIYPGMELLLSERLITEWAQIVERVEDEQPNPKQQRKINAFMEKYPFALQAFKKLLWAEKTSWLGASALVMLNQPDADAEVLRFALSDWGDNESRMEAALMLSKVGRYQSDEPVNFWNADKEEWHEVQMFSQRIDEVEYNIKPATAALIEQARTAKDPGITIKLLRKAVEDDPTCAMALHNLGVLLTQQGENEEGETLIRRAVEVDPTYTFGFANLGFLEAQRGNKEAALDHLMKVNQAKVVAPNAITLANLAYMILALEDQDFEKARQHFDMAESMDPDNPLLDSYRENLELLEKFGGMSSFFRDFQKQSANRYHRKMLKTQLSENMDLEACLATMTTDNLSTICAFWKIQGYGKKKEKVDRLAVRILDLEIFTEIFENIVGDERTALEDVLNQGGWMPWNQFIEKFGDDMDESDYWKYHEPESIPGRLKRAGLLFVGKLNGQEVAFIPVDVRPLLRDALSRQ